jgi:predicted nucleic acid-binding protein
MIAVDVNVIAYVWLPSAHTQAVNELLLSDPDWISCFLWRSEFRNILSGYVRRGQYSLIQAIDIQTKVEEQMKGKEFMVESSSVLSLVGQSNCSAYDCEYVALANQMNIKLISYDKQIIGQFPSVAMTAEAYLNHVKK